MSGYAGNTFPLVLAEDIDNWKIDGVYLENALYGVYTTATSDYLNTNAGITIERCENFSVINCSINKYTIGIAFSDCNSFSISGNRLYDGSAETEATYEAGTYASVVQAGGAIASGQQQGVLTPPSHSFTISNNVIENFGLDIGIDVISNGFARGPSTITGNAIRGGFCGIQVYQGGLADDGSAVTYQRNCTIGNNVVTYQKDQGIYVRLTQGCIVSNNMVRKANMNGVTLEIGSAYGGIVTRVSLNSVSVVSAVSDDVGNLITGNMVLDTGRDAVGCMTAIQCRVEGTKVIGNTIVQSSERGYTRADCLDGIAVADAVGEFDISGNTIRGFASAITSGVSSWINSGLNIGVIAGNTIDDCNTGIVAEKRGVVIIENNRIANATSTAISVRYAPYSVVKNNFCKSCAIGLQLNVGCYDSDINTRSTNRIGATLHVENNIFQSCTTPHNLLESTPTDALFSARCAVWRGDTVNGEPVGFMDTSGTPQTTFNQKSWHQGDVWLDTTPAASGFLGSVCVTGGTYGTISGAVTGAITSGTAALVVNDSGGLAPGVYITIAGVSGVKKVLTVSGVNVTLTSNADATVSGAAVAYSPPVFKTYGAISA